MTISTATDKRAPAGAASKDAKAPDIFVVQSSAKVTPEAVFSSQAEADDYVKARRSETGLDLVWAITGFVTGDPPPGSPMHKAHHPDPLDAPKPPEPIKTPDPAKPHEPKMSQTQHAT
jgi:hypothetical protein